MIQKIVVFRLILRIFFAAFRWQPLCCKQSPAFTQNFLKNVSLFLQKHMKLTLVVRTTASPITTIRRVLYPRVNITLYYFEKLRNCCINFVSTINAWTVFIPCSSTASMEELKQRVELCLTMCTEQSPLAPLTKETDE